MSPPAPGVVPAAGPVTEFPAADLERRFTAYAVDRLLAWGVAAGIGYGVGRLVAPGEFLPAAGIAIGALLLIGTVTAVVLGLTALTPGMAFTGLRVVRAADGMPIGVGAALLRTIVLGLAGLPTLGLGAAMLAWTAAMDPSGRRRARHDRIGDAVVVDVRPRPVVEVEADDRPQQIVNLTAMRLLPSPAPQPTTTPERTATPTSASDPTPGPAPRPVPAPAPAPNPKPMPRPQPTPPAQPAPTPPAQPAP
ncbi:RDD family protein, partial [Nocardioides sp. BGMRC 2183]